MKKLNLGKRLVALVLVFIMVVTLVPASVFAANIGDIGVGDFAGSTGIKNETLNQDGIINWPIKVYDYLSDGMLFEFAQYGGTTLYSSYKGLTSSTSGGGQYMWGEPMPYGNKYTTDYTADATYSTNAYSQHSTRGVKYTRTAVPASNNANPRYLRLKANPSANSSSNRNYVVAEFNGDNGANASYSDIRYMVLVYRSEGMNTSKAADVHGLTTAPMTVLVSRVTSTTAAESTCSWLRYDISSWTNSTKWTYKVIDLQSIGFNAYYTCNLAINPNFKNTSAYLDLSHVGFFSSSTAANTFGAQCVQFDNDPGEYLSGTTWNSANNTAFGMLYATNGGDHGGVRTGGAPSTTTLGGVHGGYYTHQIGYTIPRYYTSTSPSADQLNANRKTGKDANGRFDGTGNEQGENGIYFITGTYKNSANYKADYPDKTGFDMSILNFDEYKLFNTASSGVWTAGLLEGKLGASGVPEYRQETVEYIADLLSKTLTIPEKGTNGNYNYSYIRGVRNAEQYGTTSGTANDLAQGLRNCLGITFTSGQSRGSTPQMGTYAETIAKADKLRGKFLPIANAGHIKTCMDAAYYILHNLFIDDSYNQLQDDFRYLTLSSATLDSGAQAYVFDGGFANGASNADLAAGNISQADYKTQSKTAVEYNSLHLGLAGNIGLTTVNEKDLYHYSSNAVTTRFPFLPVVDSEGVYAGETKSYYFAEDGKKSYDIDGGTYKGRNYNYTMVSNGEFIFVEDDDLYFEFEGDDDVYLFLNGELVLDIGGGHSISSCSLNVNDYVEWARGVLANPSEYSARDIERANALNLEDGEIVSFDFYYMERHGYGANCRIVTNMVITDPALRVQKSAHQGGKEIDFGGIIDAEYPVEYNFQLFNRGNTKLYNLTVEDSDIGVSITPENGLYVEGDGNSSVTDDINGTIVTDAQGGKLEATDITAVVEGYQKVDSGGDYIVSGDEYVKVEAGTGTHIYHDGILINFKSNDDLKKFMKTLEAEGTDNSTIDDEQTQSGAGLWVDASVTFKGIYYTLRKEQKQAGVFNNTVHVSGTTKSDPNANGNEKLTSESKHRVYLRAIPSYYQWSGHDLFIPEKTILDDATKESGNEGSLLSEYHEFFTKVNGDTSIIYTNLCDKNGNAITYPNVTLEYTKDRTDWGCVTNYEETGVHEFYLFMRLQSAPSSNPEELTKDQYAIVRVLVIVADVEDSVYVLDYGLRTENLDVHGELFKNDDLLGAMSGTDTKLMGLSTKAPSYLSVKDETTDFNRIAFETENTDEDKKLEVSGDDGKVDGHFTANLNIGEEGKLVKYDEYSGMYSLTDSGTSLIHADVPYAWDNLNIYYWYDDGTNNGWPGVPMTKTSAGTYKLAIPGNVPHVILTANIPVYDENGNLTGTEFRQTVDIDINPGEEAWVTVKPELNGDGKFPATVSYNSTDGIIHASVPDDWDEVYYHCWDAFGNPLTEWPGTKIEGVDGDGYYTFKIPGDITNIILNNGDKGKQTDDLKISAGKESWIMVNNSAPSFNEGTGVYYYNATITRSDKTISIHANVPSDWNCAYAYYWNSNGSSTGVEWPGIEMTPDADPENEGVYHLDNFPADVTNIIINNGKDGGKQTLDTMITPGLETWLDVRPLDTESYVSVEVPSDWGDVYFYFFNDNGYVERDWPGFPVEKGADGKYSMEVPAYASHFIVNNNQGRQTADLGFIYKVDNEYIVRSDNSVVAQDGSSSRIVINEKPAGIDKLYIHYWGGATETSWPGVEITDTDAQGRYMYDLPGDTATYLIHNNDGWQTSNTTVVYPGDTNIVSITMTDARTVCQVSTEAGDTSGQTRIVLTGTPENFGNAYIHYWGGTGGTNWPGIQLTEKDSQGRLYVNLPADNTNFLIHNNSGWQTSDASIDYKGGVNLVNVAQVYSGGNCKTSSEISVPWKNTMIATYGDDALAEGFSFTPTDFMDSEYNLYMALTIHEPLVNSDNDRVGKPTTIGGKTAPTANPNTDYTVDIGKEVQLFKKVSVVPANVVYYEDDFTGVTYLTSAPNMMTHYGDGSGSLTQKVDQNGNYGNDITYQGSENDEQTGGSLINIDVKNPSDLATFTFKGTGFELIGHTRAVEPGIASVVVTGANGFRKEIDVITEFDNGDDGGTDTITSVPIVRVSGLEYGEYTVSIQGIPVIDFENWDFTGDPPVLPSYIYIDGYRIYQPIQGGKPKSEYGLLSLNTEVTAETGIVDQYMGDPTDGKAYVGTNWAEGDWFGFKQNSNVDADGQGVLRVNLGKLCRIDFMRANVFSTNDDASIGNPTYIEVYYSDQEDTGYKFAGSLKIGTEANVAYWADWMPYNGIETIDAQYVKFKFGPGAFDKTWVMVDEIEIYGYEIEKTDGYHDAYLDTEKGAEFNEVRDLISKNQGFAVEYTMEDGLIVSGGTTSWTENRNNADVSDGREWTGNKVTSVGDYLLAGPNNEVYLVESTDQLSAGIAFYVTETDDAVHDIQVAVRGMDYGAFIGATATGYIHAQLQYGAVDEDGQFVWKNLASIVSTSEQYYTIPYKECPYDEENDRYQVVLRVADTSITGMASFTSVKTNGLIFNTLNSSDLPEVIYEDELTNEMIDRYGNTIASSAFVDFLALSNQMKSQVVMNIAENDAGETIAVIEGVNTSSMAQLYDSYTHNSAYDFNITKNSKIYIVTSSESTAPSQETIETAQLVQKQFAADSLPTADKLRIVWGLEEYAEPGDILIYANSNVVTAAESYKLEVTDRAKVYAKDDNGLLYGLNTLHKHFRKAGTTAIEGFTIVDAPDTKERTVHLDMARKYLTKNWICNYIREMSWMGYNAIELHISEDGGFRTDLWDDTYYPQVPGNTDNDFSWAIGSMLQPWCYDCPDPDMGKYLTASEMIEIFEVAKEYNMEVIPSFDTPAHVGWITKKYESEVQNGNTSVMRFNYNGTTYSLPNRINYRSTGTYDYAVLNLGNANVQKLAFAMYTDIAAFFHYYAGSTHFNIGADEVGLASTDTWDYADFIDYVNDLNDIIKAQGYESIRMYNDFADRPKYQSMTDRTLPTLDSDIEIVFWDGPNTNGASWDTTKDIKKADAWVSEGRNIYSGVQFWTYYTSRIANTPGNESNANFGKDSRDPTNTWWTFYRNQEDYIYDEWNTTRFSEYTDTTYSYYYSGDKLAGGYFMVWMDYAGVNTEVEHWNGVWDSTNTSSNGKYFYSLRYRMWSNIIKQWNWDIDSTLSFADFKNLRNAMGTFPGIASGTDGCSKPATFTAATDAVGPYRTEYTVNFVDYDGNLIDSQLVMEGLSAVAPADPEREDDAWFTYEFTGWSESFDNVTSNMTIVAQYKETSTIPGIYGNFEVEVSGGSNFNLSVNDGTARPMGTSYKNARMDLATKITVTAETTSDNKFIGWINAATSEILTTSRTYTFYTSGSDNIIALFDTNLPNMSTVIFKNDIANQIVDIQYYAADSHINFPEGPAYLGYEFLGWNLTEAEILQKIVDGKDVTVLPVWGLKDSFFTISVAGGSITNYEAKDADGKYVGYKGTTVTANEPASGKKFAYWTNKDGQIVSYDAEYKFYPYEDTALTAVFVNDTTAVNKSVIVDAAVDTTTYADKNSIIMAWSVPEDSGLTFINAGVLIVDDENFNETKFALGTNDINVIQFVPARRYQLATAMHSITQTGVYSGDTMHVKAFVQYRDAQGILQVAYSDTVTCTK